MHRGHGNDPPAARASRVGLNEYELDLFAPAVTLGPLREGAPRAELVVAAARRLREGR